MQTDAKAVVVARALVEGDIEVRLERLEPVEVRVGEPLILRFVYHITESSPLKDAWRMSLKTRHDDGERLATNGYGDHLLIKDVIWDALDETFTFTEPGAVTVHFDAQAHMERVAWVGGRVPAVTAESVRGSVAVLVLP